MYPLLRRAITVVSGANVIRFREGATTASAVVPVGTYWLRASGTGSLLLAIKAALEAASASLNTYDVTLSLSVSPTAPTGAVTITRTSGADAFRVDGADGLTTFPLHVIGFENVTGSTTTAPKVSTKSPSGLWLSNDMLAVDEPDFRGEVFGEDPSRGGVVVAGAQSETWDEYAWEPAHVARARVWQEANPADPNATWEAFWRRVRSAPALELARLDPTTFAVTDMPGLWVLDRASRERVGPVRRSAALPQYRWPIRFQRWVTP